MSMLRRFIWWLQRERKEEQLREELQFHLDQEMSERRHAGLPEDDARWAARRDLGNEARLGEDVRTLWTWRPLDELTQDLRYACRMLVKNRAVTLFAALSLASGIGASTAIYSFMDALLLRSLPVPDPASMVVMTWQSKQVDFRRSRDGSEFVTHSISGSIYRNEGGMEARIFPFPAFQRLQEVSAPVLSSLFAFYPAGNLNVMINGEAELAPALYVSGEFFRGVAVSPAVGRLLVADDDRANAPPAAVMSAGFAQRRFGAASNAVGQQILINNLSFSVVGVTAPEFFGVDPGAAVSVYLPMHAQLMFDPSAAPMYTDQNYYWTGIMGRLRPGVTHAQAEAALTTPFDQWAASTATTDRERVNLPVLRAMEGGGGLDSLRRQYSKPLYLLLVMVGLILAIACANTANLLLARASTRRREIAVRLSIGAGRLRLIRQLLTESVLLSSLSGALGIVIAIGSARVLTGLLANGDDGFTLQVDMNWRVLLVTLGLSLLCGVLFGLAPALQSTRPALVPALKDAGVTEPRGRGHHWIPRWSLSDAFVVTQISILLLLLMSAGLFVRSLSNLQHIQLGFNRDNLLLFDLDAPQAGYPEANAAAFYADLRRRFAEIPGVRAATLSHASLIRAGRAHPITIDGVPAQGTRFLQAGPGFFTAMQIPMRQGREFDERDREGTLPVAVISELFAQNFFPNQNPLGRHIKVAGSSPMEVEVVGVSATARYGGLKYVVPPVIYVPYSQVPMRQLRQMTYALRTDGSPLSVVAAARRIVHEADARVPMTNVTTQAAEIDRTINQEIVLARLGSAFAVLALVIACVGLYGTVAYAVARRTREIGVRMALGARRRTVMWMVWRRVCVLAALGLAISVPIARGTSRFIASFLFDMTPNDPRATAVAVGILLSAALVASYGPARRASRIDPIAALRHE